MTQRDNKVLIANHHPEPLPEVTTALRGYGFQVTSTANLVDTAARLETEPPDLLVFQPLAPRADGFEMQALHLHTGEGPRPLVILILESAADVAALVGAEHPVDDFLVRPVSGPEVVGRVRFNLQRSHRLQDLRTQMRRRERDSITDFKTDLFNDRYFDQRLQEELQRARRHQQAVSLILLDLDDFKRINDEHEHAFGDHVLHTFAHKLRSVTRQIDIPARVGGDEFALLLPGTDLEEASVLASRLRQMIDDTRFEQDGHVTRLSVSMGIHSVRGEDALSPKELQRRADLALLEAKRRGKNRICLYDELDHKSRAAGA